MATVARILSYPAKSLPGVAPDRCAFAPGGALRLDRSLAIVDERGDFVSGKTEPRIHALGARIGLADGDPT